MLTAIAGWRTTHFAIAVVCGKHPAEGGIVFVFAGENEGGTGLIRMVSPPPPRLLRRSTSSGKRCV
jgi:hypothetical protein